MDGKVWNLITNERVDLPEKVSDFYKDIEDVCKKHNLSISHEDGHGSFEIVPYNDDVVRWLKQAMIKI